MQKEGQNSNLYRILEDCIPSAVITNKNRVRSWLYGYNDQYNVIVISKTGQIGQILEIEGLHIALPPMPDKCLQRHPSKKEQYWQRQETPKELAKIQSIFQWNEKSKQFKDLWVDYIEQEFDYREQGFWFINTYVS